MMLLLIRVERMVPNLQLACLPAGGCDRRRTNTMRVSSCRGRRGDRTTGSKHCCWFLIVLDTCWQHNKQRMFPHLLATRPLFQVEQSTYQLKRLGGILRTGNGGRCMLQRFAKWLIVPIRRRTARTVKCTRYDRWSDSDWPIRLTIG
jgi:hypothetical protein